MTKFTLIIISSLLLLSCAGTKTSSSKKAKNEEGQSLSYEDQSRVLRMLLDGEREEMKNNPVKAISYYRECIEIDPENDVCYFKLATVYYSQGNFQTATTRINKAIELNKTNKWYYLLQAKCYLGISDAEKATEAFRKVIELEPDNIQYQLELVELYAQQYKFKEAIIELEKIEERYGTNPEFSIRKQDFYMANGQADKAIETCKSLIAQFPNQPNYYGLLAILYESIGDGEKEFETYQKLISLDPGNGLAHLKLSEIYQRRGDREKSESELAEAIKSTDLDIDVKINVLTQYYQKLNADTSIWGYVSLLLENFELSNPNDARTYSVIGDFLSLHGDYLKSREYLLKSISLQKDRFQVWNQLIILDSQLSEWDDMLMHSEEALSMFPSNPALYYYLGIAYFQKEEYEEAIEILETGKMMIFKTERGLIDFYVLLGDAYNSIDDFAKSDENYDLALKDNPDNAYVLNNYAYYLSLRKDKLELAEQMAKRAVELEPNQYNYQDTYGWVLFQLEKYEEASNWLKLAVNNGGRVNGEIIEHYADALYKSGNVEEAIKYWKEAKAVGDASDKIDEKIKLGTYID